MQALQGLQSETGLQRGGARPKKDNGCLSNDYAITESVAVGCNLLVARVLMLKEMLTARQ